VATPDGERRIADIEVGDLVYSIHRHAIVAVRVQATRRNPVEQHRMVRLRLATGANLELSPSHPTADGGWFDALTPDSLVDGIAIEAIERVPYREQYTYDILPASDTGVYFAAGVAVGSTLFLDERPLGPPND
jgi:hypothetical protein